MSPQTPRSSPAAQEGSAGSETEGRLSPGTGRPLELKAFVQEAAEKLSEVASPPLRTGSGCRLSSERSFKTEERCVPGVEDLAPKLGVPSLSLLGSGMEAVAAGACEESLEIPYEFEQRVILQGREQGASKKSLREAAQNEASRWGSSSWRFTRMMLGCV